jgi:predicted acetyltransferase
MCQRERTAGGKMPTVSVRESRVDEIPLLVRLIRESFREVAERFALTSANCPSHPSFVTQSNVREGFEKGGKFWIVEEDAEPCGCVGLVPGHSGVHSLVRLAVLPAHRRRGLGGWLVQRVLQEARRLKLPKVELGIIAAQTELQRLYERHGFRVTQTRRFEHLPFDVTLMVAELAGGCPSSALHPGARLAEPTASLRNEFLAMASEYHKAGDDRYDAALADFDGYMKQLAQAARWENVPEDRSPMDTYWLMDGGRVIGASRLRHWLVPHLKREGGNIGYDIRPTQRRKGYGKTILALMLAKAREAGLQRVLVTCDTDNAASARIIGHNGGVSASHTTSARTGKQVSRYWITL